MTTTVFDPKAGSLKLSFTNGKSYSFTLQKTYHREEDFYIDLFWEENGSSSSLSLALHPKTENLILSSCALEWSLSDRVPSEVLTQRFIHPSSNQWEKAKYQGPSIGFWKKQATKKLNWYEPLPHPSIAVTSYQSIALRQNKWVTEIKSSDESAALTVFTLPKNEQRLVADKQAKGYRLRHSFPAFELQFNSNQQPSPPLKNKTSFSIAMTPRCINQSWFQTFAQSSLVEEGNIQSFLLREHGHSSPGNAGFDTSQYSAFAKTANEAMVSAGIELNPFVVRAKRTTLGIKVDNNSRFKRWSPSLRTYIQPIDLSDEETMRICEQHLMQFYQLGFRFFILHDIALSLRDGLSGTTTGQQLAIRLDLIRRVLPGAAVVLGDLCASQAFKGFRGFKAAEPFSNQLPSLARFAGMGVSSPKYGKLAPYRMLTRNYISSKRNDGEKHTLFDVSGLAPESSPIRAIESTIGSFNYPS